MRSLFPCPEGSPHHYRIPAGRTLRLCPRWKNCGLKQVAPLPRLTWSEVPTSVDATWERPWEAQELREMVETQAKPMEIEMDCVPTAQELKHARSQAPKWRNGTYGL